MAFADAEFRPGNNRPDAAAASTPEQKPKRRNRLHRFTAFEVQLYHLLDSASGILLLCMVFFSPWAFGTTQPWSVWSMNIAGYVLGTAFLLKIVIRKVRGYSPARWERSTMDVESAADRQGPAVSLKWVIPVLGIATCAILAWCLGSALNARATFNNDTLSFEYFGYIPWLPHSLDRTASWFAFWMYLGLAGTFWAARDWLLGRSQAELRQRLARMGDETRATSFPMPERLRVLLWALAASGALLAVEAMIQRAANSPKLLFLVKPRIHETAESQFGPFAYRSNAAQYFNLLWPVCLGFWWTLNRNRSPGERKHHLLLAAVTVLAAAPIVSTSRAGAIVAVAMAVAGAFLLWTGPSERARKARKPVLRCIVWCLGATLIIGLALGWEPLAVRLPELGEDLAGRERMYDAARPIAKDYPLFGIGPGSFETVSQLYPRPDMFWPAQLHNDWLETRITFGWAGSSLIALAFLCVLLSWFHPGGIHGGRRFIGLTWIALIGCLLHARYDFPFQIHSTLFLFLLLCSVLTTLSRRT